MRRLWFWWAAVTCAALATVLGLPTAAFASCAAGPTPSPYRFVGTVVSLSDAGRVAEVQPQAGGPLVEVRGSDAGPGAGSSVDRAYQLRGVYEFDPVNGQSPYRDNACTATHLLSTGGGQVATVQSWAYRVGPPLSADRPPLWQRSLGALSLAVVAGLSLLILGRQWRRSHRTGPTGTESGPGAGS